MDNITEAAGTHKDGQPTTTKNSQVDRKKVSGRSHR